MGGESAVAPRHDGPPQDPTERRKERKTKETEEEWEGGAQNMRAKVEERIGCLQESWMWHD